jgi:LysM repeat protein
MALNNMSSERVKRGETLKVKAPGQDESDAETGIAETTTEVAEVQTNETTSEELAQNEQALYDEVKNIEREAATKAPYKGSYTKQSAEQPTASTKAVRADEQTPRRQASKANTSDWRERNNKYTHKDSASKKDRKKSEKSTERSSKSSKRSKKAKPERPSEVTVQKGESLTKIAEKTGVSVSDLKRANGIDDGNKIKAGEKIKIPTKAEAKQAAAAEKKGSKSKSSSKGSGSKTSKKSSSGSKSSSDKGSGKSSGKKKSKKH